MLLCGSAVGPADSWKVVASPLSDCFRRLARRVPDRSFSNEKMQITNTKEMHGCKHDRQKRKAKMDVIYPWSHPRPGSRLAGYKRHSPALFSLTVQSVGCRSRARLDQGSTVDLALHSYWAPSFFFRHTVLGDHYFCSLSSPPSMPRAVGSTA